jgi:hypothetical protein
VRKGATVIVLLVFSVALLLPFSVCTQKVSAQGSYQIQNVEHQVEVLYSGNVVIKDTIHLSGQLTGEFLIGFPNEYGSGVIRGIAYGDGKMFQLGLGVPFGESGFYGARVNFPQGAPQEFTVIFFLSNELVTPRTNGFILDFPAYPSLVQDVALCNVSLVLPEVAALLNITKEDGVVYTEDYAKQGLKAFTHSPATAIFNLPEIWIRLVNMISLNREITVDPAGRMQASDSYRVTNNSPNIIDSLRIIVPDDVSNLLARDEIGRILSTELLTTGATPIANVTFATPFTSDQSATLTIEYTLPNIIPQKGSAFTIDYNLFPDFNYYIDKASVQFSLPEGAKFLSPTIESIGATDSLNRDLYQETLTLNREGVSKKEYDVFSENVVDIAYEYNPLWLSFYPTLWVWTLALIGVVVTAIWRRPKRAEPTLISVAKVPTGLSPDHIRDFTEAYNEKTRLSSELEVLEGRAQKGRIPRRRYKVQKRTLEVRLETISKNITKLKRSIRSAGGVYADLVRQLEVAEAELLDVERNIRTSEVRHRRGQLPLEAYKKSLADCQRRKEKAETTINGILLRLREELR